MGQKKNDSPLHPWIGIRRDWRKRGGGVLPNLIGLTPAELRTHALVIGATGSGKTNLLHHLIKQDLERGHSVAVLDLRGDLVDAVVAMCTGRIDAGRVALLDLREKERPNGFDPLRGPGEAYYRALGVLDAVETESGSWGVQLAETLRYGLMLMAETGRPLTDLERLFLRRQVSCGTGLAGGGVSGNGLLEAILGTRAGTQAVAGRSRGEQGERLDRN